MILDNHSGRDTGSLQDQRESPGVSPTVTPAPSTCEVHVHVKTPVATTDPTKDTKEVIQFASFSSWKWRWLAAIQLLFFVPFLGFVTPSKFLLWVVLNLVGYAYVSVCNLERPDPLHGNGLIKLLIASPFVFMLGPYWTLQDFGTTITFWNGFGSAISYTGFEAYFLYPLTSSVNVNQSRYTFLCYVVPFLVSLHITYLEYVPFFKQIILTRRDIANLPFMQTMFLISMTTVTLIWMLIQVYLLSVANQLQAFALVFLVGWAIVLLATHYEMQYHNGSVHLHLFQLCALIVPFTVLPNVLAAIVQAFMAGVYVEALTRLQTTSCRNE